MAGRGVFWYDGVNEIPVELDYDGFPAKLYYFDGVTEHPCFEEEIDPPSSGFVGASSVYHAGSQTDVSLPVPAGVLATDLCILAGTQANAAATAAAAGMSTLIAPTDAGSMQAQAWVGPTPAGGGSIAIAGTNLAPGAIGAVWYRDRTFGAVATQARSANTLPLVTPAAPGGDSGDLVVVIGFEKSGSNTDTLPPTVPAGVTQRVWVPWPNNVVGLPSLYIGEVSLTDASAAITLNYLRSSLNGFGAQVRLD